MKNKKCAPRVAMISLGCPKNLVDSEKMMAQLAQGGCVVGAPMAEADVVVVNTCGFLAAAREESLEVIREALACKQANPMARVVVAGCLVNRDGEALFESAKGIDAIVGVNDRERLLRAVLGSRRVSFVTAYERGTGVPPVQNQPVGKRFSHRHDHHGRDARATSDAGRFRLTARHTAYLRISEGCSQRCTFCTIPSIRGPFRSKSPLDVLAEARELLADGAVELNVIGQDTTSYGMDFDEGAVDGGAGPNDLAALMSSLADLDGARWIRLLYAYPMRFSPRLIDVMAERENIVKYVDIPLQHMSDGVLRRMGRRVTRAKTEALLRRLREVPGMAIRTTFIVGFPGESETEFSELLSFVQEFKFDALGVFEFSPEPGTPAVRLKGPVDAAVKADRAKRIMLAQQKIAFAANRRRKGKQLDVLVDGVDSAGRCIGRHPGQAPDIDGVCVLSKPAKAGTIVRAKVIGAEGYDLRVTEATSDK